MFGYSISDILLMLLFTALGILFVFIIYVGMNENRKDDDNVMELHNKIVVINNDTLRIIGNDGDDVIFNNGTKMYYGYVYVYVRGVK